MTNCLPLKKSPGRSRKAVLVFVCRNYTQGWFWACYSIHVHVVDCRRGVQTSPSRWNVYGCFRKKGVPLKSSILIGFSIINHPFWSTTIFGSHHIIFFCQIDALKDEVPWYETGDHVDKVVLFIPSVPCHGLLGHDLNAHQVNLAHTRFLLYNISVYPALQN